MIFQTLNSVSKIIAQTRQYIDTTVFANSLVPPLKEMAIDSDKDVAHFAQTALKE